VISVIDPYGRILDFLEQSRYFFFQVAPELYSRGWHILKKILKAVVIEHPCFRPFWIGNLSDKCLPIQTLLYVSFNHILMNLTSFMGTPSSMRILYNTSLLTES
jgi:hypothetical protein